MRHDRGVPNRGLGSHFIHVIEAEFLMRPPCQIFSDSS